MEARDHQQRHWNAVADGWDVWFDWTQANFGAITEWFHAAAGWKAGARVLDEACGAGYPALVAATHVRPGGSVIAIDVSPEMVAVASRRAKAGRVDNIQVIEMDAEALHFTDGSFDAVTNAYGLMFCPEPQRALAEIHRVLKPGGRVALTAWDDPSRSPFFNVVSGVAASWLSLPPPEPGAPGPFRFAPTGRLDALLRDAGFRDARVESLPATFELASADEYLRVFRDVAWKARVATLSGADVARLREAVAEASRPFTDKVSGRLRLAATSLCASGRR